MSTREMAISIINGFSEEQLIEFVRNHSKSADNTPKKRTKREAYEHLKKSVMETAPLYADIGDNDNEMRLKYLDEKYGEGI